MTPHAAISPGSVTLLDVGVESESGDGFAGDGLELLALLASGAEDLDVHACAPFEVGLECHMTRLKR